VLHHIRDITVMRGPVFFRLAWRLPAYQGAVRAALMAQQQAEENPGQEGQWPHAAGGLGDRTASPSAARRVVPATRGALSLDGAFKGIFTFGNAGKPEGGSG
jgi:hypothetical protein